MGSCFSEQTLFDLIEECTGLAAAMEKVYQLLVHGWRFFLGTLASSTIKTGCHDIAEILLKVVLSTINQINQSNSVCSLKQQTMDRHVTH
jgi:hypothetical protein